MSRWHILLIAGVAALPSGCVTLPYSIGMPDDVSQLAAKIDLYRAGQSAAKPDPGAATDLPPAQAAKVCLATAVTLEEQGHDREAILEYQRARNNDPHLPRVARHLAVLYAKQGDTEHARDEFRLALQEQPYDAELLNDVGYFHFQVGDLAAAENDLRQSLALNATLQRAWVNLGKVLARRGHYEESCEAFGKVVRPAQAAANVGILLAKEGKSQEARQVLHKALALEPDLKAARAVLTQLESAPPPEVRLTVE